jgi:hypothetical protein
VTTVGMPLSGTEVRGWEVLDEPVDLSGQRREIRRARLRRTARKFTGVLIPLIVWEIGAAIIADASFLPTVQATVHTFFYYLNRPYPSTSAPL